MRKVEQEVIGCTPELGFGDAGDGGIGDAVKKLPGKPYRFDGFLFGFQDVAMVVYDGTLGKIRHNDDLHSELMRIHWYERF